MVVWREIDGGNQKNTAVAASGFEIINFTDSRFKKGFNGLEICNLDAVDIEVRLNGESSAGKIFWVPAGTVAVINPDEGRTYDFLHVYNLDAANAEVADKILYRASRSEVMIK